MTTKHAALTHFNGRYESAKKRLLVLKKAGLVAQHRRKKFEPALLHLGTEGIELLRLRGELDRYPQLSSKNLRRRASAPPLALFHDLEVADVKSLLCAAMASRDVAKIVEFSTWPLLNQFTIQGEIVKPDGFLRFRPTQPSPHGVECCCFLELDRSTEAQTILVTRALQYYALSKAGAFKELYGKPSFRVLFVMQNEERRNNTIELLLSQRPPILTQVWLTTISDLRKCPLGNIWVRPVDYRDCVEESAFTALRFGMSRYRRNAVRDNLVAKDIARHKLV